MAAGYQYQNVLTLDISKLIAEKVSNVGYVFSGDDHDYCDLVHRSYASAGAGIREITVKSISWAMGVRHPGFVMRSLWNPVDAEARSGYDIAGGQKIGDATLQSHLCLLPDQLGIFIRYAICAVFSLLVLAIYTVVEVRKTPFDAKAAAGSSPLLPTSEPKFKDKEAKPWASADRTAARGRSRAPSTSVNPSCSDGSNASLSARSKNARTRSVSPMPVAVGGYTLPTFTKPLIEQAGYYGTKNFQIQDGETDDWGNPPVKIRPRKPKSWMRRVGEGFARKVGTVGGIVFVWYWWLLRSG